MGDEIDPDQKDVAIDPAKITRNILADKPRVTRFGISWDGVEETKQDAQLEPQQQQQDNDDDEEEEEKEEEEEESEEEDDDEGSVDLEETEEADRNTGDKKMDTDPTGNETDQDIDMID